jgi:hypothetical protein
MMFDHIDFAGETGLTYRYWFAGNTPTAALPIIGGNYGFVKSLPNGNYLPLYFGEGGDLRDRIVGHEKWLMAVALGAVAIVAHSTPGGALARLAEERDLIRYWNPVLNQQHRTAG